jgi:hypothetical protein
MTRFEVSGGSVVVVVVVLVVVVVVVVDDVVGVVVAMLVVVAGAGGASVVDAMCWVVVVADSALVVVSAAGSASGAVDPEVAHAEINKHQDATTMRIRFIMPSNCSIQVDRDNHSGSVLREVGENQTLVGQGCFTQQLQRSDSHVQRDGKSRDL